MNERTSTGVRPMKGFFAIFLISFSVTACDGEPATGEVGEPDPTQDNPTNAVDNGATTGAPEDSDDLPFDLADITYSTGVSDTEYSGEERTPLTLCDFVTAESDYVGLVRVVSIGDAVVPADCNDKEYRSIHRVIELERVADVHVAPMMPGPTLSAIWIGSGFEFRPQPDDYLLVTLRESEGEWFQGRQLLALADDYDAVDPYEREVDLPADFTELTRRTKQILADYGGECPDQWVPLNDEEYAIWIRDSAPCGPGSGTEEEDVGVVDVPRADGGSDQEQDMGNENDAGM